MRDMHCDVHALFFIPVLWQCYTVLYSTCCYTCIQPEVVDEAAGPDNDDATRLDDHRTGASPPRGTAPVWAARPPRAYGGAAVVGQPTLVRWLSRLATPPIQGPRLTTPSPHAAEVGLRRPWPCGRETPRAPSPGAADRLGTDQWSCSATRQVPAFDHGEGRFGVTGSPWEGPGRASGCRLASLGKHSRRAAQDLRSTPHAAVADDPLTRRQRRARGADVVLEGPPHRRSPHDMHVLMPRPRACTCTLLTSPPSQCLILRASSSASAPLPSLLLLIIIHRYRPYFVTIWLTTIIVTSSVS